MTKVSRIPLPRTALSKAAALIFVSTTAFAASGTWTGTAGNGLWSDSGNWSGTTIADGSGFTADFSTLDVTSDTTVHLDGSRTLTNLVFGDTNTTSAAGWILDNNGNAANILTLAGTTPTITVNALGTGKNVAISSILTGTVGFTKAGAGTLVLSGANTFSGGVNLAGGTLQISSAGNLPSGNTLTFTNGAILNTSAAMTLANAVVIASGQTGTIRGTPSGATTSLTGNYSGVAGTLTLDVSNGSGYSGIAIGNGSTGPASGAVVNLLGTTNANNVQLGISSTGARTFFANVKLSVTATGAGQTYIAGGNAGATNVQFGALEGGNATTLIGFDNATGSTVTINGVTDANFSGRVIDGLGGSSGINVIKNGAATQTVSGQNTYTGTTTLNAGTLQFAKQVSLYNNGTANWTAAKIIVNSGATAAFNVGGTGEFTSANIDTLKALGTATGGFMNGSKIGLDTTNAAGGVFSYASAITNTFSDANAIGLTKLGAGTLALSGANTYTGGTTVAAGTLQVSTGGAINVGASGVTVASGATLALAGTGKLVLTSASATIANTGTVNGTGVIDLNGLFNTYNGGGSGVYELITGAGIESGTFSVTGYDTGVWSSVSYNAGNLSFSAVPEPSTYGLLGAGALAAASFVRRRRRTAR